MIVDLSEHENLNESACEHESELNQSECEVELEPVTILKSASEFDPALANRDFIVSDKPIRPLIKLPVTNKRKFVKSW